LSGSTLGAITVDRAEGRSFAVLRNYWGKFG